jgi:uncharacterized protein YjbI with pentapeptide repeats
VTPYYEFFEHLHPSAADMLALIRGGAAQVFNEVVERRANEGQKFSFTNEHFDGLTFEGFDFEHVRFAKCSFVGAHLKGTQFGVAAECDFSGITSEWHDRHVGAASFREATGCRFVRAQLERGSFFGSVAGADFTEAKLDRAYFSTKQNRGAAPIFRKASLRQLRGLTPALPSADFTDADLSEADLGSGHLAGARFDGAKLRGALLTLADVQKASFRGADLRGASLCEADLRGAEFQDADLSDCNLRGARLDAESLSAAQNVPADVMPRAPRPAMLALDGVAAASKEIDIRILAGTPRPSEEDYLGINSKSLSMGYDVHLPKCCRTVFAWGFLGRLDMKMSEAFIHAANHLRNHTLRLSTLQFATKKCPIKRTELRDIIVHALYEAFGEQVISD